MRRLLVTLILGVFLASAAGCADLGISNPFESTPTAASSQLLGISLPAGMELSTQHCARTTGSDGQPQGMETAYGQADRMQVAQSLFNNMQEAQRGAAEQLGAGGGLERAHEPAQGRPHHAGL